MKLKLMTILGTRPEIIRLSETIKLCDRFFNHILVHTGQNYDYELNQIFFDEFELRAPDYFLNCAGDNLGQTLGNILANSYEILLQEKPDAVLILGDTNSALSVISAKRLKIPIFHMEAGNRCWDWNVPEMINRKIVDHISDVNLPYTEHARRYLLAEGLDGKMIFVTGSPLKEIFLKYKEKISESKVLERLNLMPKNYFLLSSHREENIDNEKIFFSLMSSINALAEKYQLPIIYSTHPRSRRFIEQRQFKFNPLVKSLPPFGFFDYNKLQMEARCVLSDSGTLSEESAMLKFPAVLIRTSTERPEVLDKGTIILGGVTEKEIYQAVELAINTCNENFIEANDYADAVAMKVIKIIQSYTNVVNRTIWLKS